ncbi:hypothetical protein ACKAV7_003735, partial [Fusarium commune]
DDHYEPPAAEAGACKAVQRDTQWKSARSDTERLLARAYTDYFDQGKSDGGDPVVMRDLSFDSSRIDGSGEPTLDLSTYPTPPHFLLIPPWTAAQEPDQHMGGTVEIVSERRISWHLKRALICVGKPTFQFQPTFAKSHTILHCTFAHLTSQTTSSPNPTLHFRPSQDRPPSSKEKGEVENGVQTYPTPPYYIPDFWLPCTYPRPLIYLRLPYPTKVQTQTQTQTQTHPRTRSQVFPATQHLQIILSRKYKHADTAPLNNFFTFTYPAARDGPRPGRITSHMSTDDVRVGRTPDGTPEPLLNFRKIQ